MILMGVVLFYEEDVLKLIRGYAQQSRRLEEKQSFYDKLKGELDMHSIGYFGHVGGKRNMKGKMLLEFCLVMELCLSNTV